MRIGRLLVALAAACAAAPAAGYVRTADPDTGKALSWPVPAVAWHLNRDWPAEDTSPSCAAGAAGDPTLDAVRASFSAWERSCADLELVYGGTIGERGVGGGGAPENVVVFRRGWCSQNPAAVADPCFAERECAAIYDCYDDACAPADTSCADWRTVALTSVLYEPETGRIVGADIEVNGWDGEAGSLGTGPSPRHGWYFTCFPGVQPGTRCTSYGEDGCGFIDLRNTVTHEVGHFVGLAHTPMHPAVDPPPQDAWSTMEPSTEPGEVWKRSLSADDVAGVCAIYEPPGGCGCGSGGAAGAIALLVAALALRPRRHL